MPWNSKTEFSVSVTSVFCELCLLICTFEETQPLTASAKDNFAV